jgi:hypothetical protein
VPPGRHIVGTPDLRRAIPRPTVSSEIPVRARDRSDPATLVRASVAAIADADARSAPDPTPQTLRNLRLIDHASRYDTHPRTSSTPHLAKESSRTALAVGCVGSSRSAIDATDPGVVSGVRSVGAGFSPRTSVQ